MLVTVSSMKKLYKEDVVVLLLMYDTHNTSIYHHDNASFTY